MPALIAIAYDDAHLAEEVKIPLDKLLREQKADRDDIVLAVRHGSGRARHVPFQVGRIAARK